MDSGKYRRVHTGKLTNSYRAHSAHPNRLTPEQSVDLLAPADSSEFTAILSKVPTFRVNSRSPNRAYRTTLLEAENKELIKECKRLKEMLESPRVAAEQNRQMWRYLYNTLKRRFQKEYELKVSTLYPDQIGYREKYMSVKQECEQLRKEIEQKNEIIDKLKSDKNELLSLKTEKERLLQTITAHICPSVLQSFPGPRTIPDLLSSLWGSVLKANPAGFQYHYKQSLAAIVTEDNSDYCTHITISTGLHKSGFYVCHSEAVAIASHLSSPSDNPEIAQIPVTAFVQLLDAHQPYRLWEDVSDVLLYLRVRFVCTNISVAEVRSTLLRTTRSLSKPEIVTKLSGKTFKIKKSAEVVSDFLMRGENTIPAATLFDRLLDVIPQWSSFAALRDEFHEKLIKMVSNNDDFKGNLVDISKNSDRISISALLEITEKHQIAIHEEMLFYLLCLNYTEGVYMEISLKHMLKLTYEDYLHPESMRPIPPFVNSPSEDEFSYKL